MQTALEKLAELDEWFATQPDNKETGKLWNILTAMRGPDDENAMKKYYTTCVLRSIAFPKLAVREMEARDDIFGTAVSYVRAHFNRASGGVALPHDATGDNEYRWDYDHFYTHVKLACNALGVEPKVQSTSPSP